MNFENPLFLFGILIGPIFILTGYILYQFPPKKINFLYGYRTSKSMKNQGQWDFAQKYSARIMMLLGLIYMIFSVLLSSIISEETISFILGFGLLFLLCFILFWQVETKLKNEFK